MVRKGSIHCYDYDEDVFPCVQKSMQDLYKVIESLKEKIDSLQHDAVGRA